MHGIERTWQGKGSAMKAVGVTGPDFMPRLFGVDEPVATRDGVVVEVMAASVSDFDRAAVEGRYVGLAGQPVTSTCGFSAGAAPAPTTQAPTAPGTIAPAPTPLPPTAGR